jgi:hypothetical protein
MNFFSERSGAVPFGYAQGRLYGTRLPGWGSYPGLPSRAITCRRFAAGTGSLVTSRVIFEFTRVNRSPSVAEAALKFVALSGAAEAAPFQSKVSIRVFPQAVKPCPSQTFSLRWLFVV